ncbi:unnamed protein product, partial [Mesorhabditis spiculigera]
MLDQLPLELQQRILQNLHEPDVRFRFARTSKSNWNLLKTLPRKCQHFSVKADQNSIEVFISRGRFKSHLIRNVNVQELLFAGATVAELKIYDPDFRLDNLKADRLEIGEEIEDVIPILKRFLPAGKYSHVCLHAQNPSLVLCKFGTKYIKEFWEIGTINLKGYIPLKCPEIRFYIRPKAAHQIGAYINGIIQDWMNGNRIIKRITICAMPIWKMANQFELQKCYLRKDGRILQVALDHNRVRWKIWAWQRHW